MLVKIIGTNTLIEVTAQVVPEEDEDFEPYVRGYELEGPKGHRSRRCFRAVRWSRLELVEGATAPDALSGTTPP